MKLSPFFYASILAMPIALSAQMSAFYENPTDAAHSTSVSPAPGAGNFTGTVEAVDVGSNALHVSDAKGQVSSVNVTADTVIRRQDQEVPFYRLQTGDQVSFRRESDGSVKRIEVR